MGNIGPIKELIVHHSGGPRTQSVEAIRRYHIEHNGWSDIGYHWIIDGNAKLHVGRPPHITGAHAPPNRGRHGICVVGNNTKRRSVWTRDQRDALFTFMFSWLVLYPHGIIKPHLATKNTRCPGYSADTLISMMASPGRLLLEFGPQPHERIRGEE